jgi:putative PIN family toxin of toxin-antitoxin system
MRALLDANVYLSYLLAPDGQAPPSALVQMAITRKYTLLLTEGIIAEVRDKSENKPYLSARITQPQVERLIEILDAVAEHVPPIGEDLPRVGRDRKDDYLFAHAVVGQADVLVSGDGGVRGIERIGDVRILSPAEFVAILDAMGDPA